MTFQNEDIILSVDAMGGDVGLAVTIPAVLAFLRRQDKAQVVLVGDEAQIRALLPDNSAEMARIRVVHAPETVDMDESPQSALKNKKQSSMRLAIEEVAQGRAHAAVSAGNTGALMAIARYVLKTLEGIDRPAIAKFLPKQNSGVTCVLDLGANVDCTPEQITQFAVLGAELVRTMFPEKTSPRVGLLNIGTEDIKGTEAVKGTYRLLKKTDLNFVGNVESNEIFSDRVDVVACDGFVGNITLKAVEGSVHMMGSLLKEEFSLSFFNKMAAVTALPVLKSFRRRLDPRRYNGAIFLGLKGVVVKSHGGTDAVGFNYALQEAYQEVHADIIRNVQAGVSRRLAHLNQALAAEAEAQNAAAESAPTASTSDHEGGAA